MKTKSILTAEQMRWADQYTVQELLTSGLILMENAGRCVAEHVRQCLPNEGNVLVVAGTGNNGGDGFTAARWLTQWGIQTQIILMGSLSSLQGDAKSHALSAEASGVHIIEIDEHSSINSVHDLHQYLSHANLIVDAIFGTGLTRKVVGRMNKIIALMNYIDAPILSIDLPSGVSSDSGKVMGNAVEATWTLPIAGYKWGHFLSLGKEHCGEIFSPALIGISQHVLKKSQTEKPSACQTSSFLEWNDTYKPCFERNVEDHKNKSGHVWVFGGCCGYTGAPKLAGLGAFAAGTGMVSIACAKEIYIPLACSNMEMMIHEQESAPWQDADAIVAGPGWGKEQIQMLSKIIQTDIPLVLDADALNILAENFLLQKVLMQREGITVLTPHPGEAAGLLQSTSNEIQQDRLESVLELAQYFSCWVVLKGAGTLVASPDNDIWYCPYGSPALATAGSGDVLAGMIASLMARKLPTEKAICISVMLHALSGEVMAKQGSVGWLAGDIPEIIRQLTTYETAKKS
ncbi:MAG: NAD(P)H-hydrate dehydratase [Mariprofundaceae bacterium]|nr:NAD(P)H-hydrate dehydratase [Mariprofundaceae bacterium]